MNAVSVPQQYTVSGSALVNDITVTAPAGFEVSVNATAGFANTLTLPQSAGTVATTNIYVRFAPTTATGSTGNLTITNASTPATTRSVTVFGIALAVEPTMSGSISFGVVTDTTIEVNLPTVGDGSRRMIVANLGAPPPFTPTDAIAIGGVNANYNLAADQGAGERIIYDGTGSGNNVVKMTGLTPGMLYYFTVYEYNVGTNNSWNYLINPAAVNNMTTSLPNLGVGGWGSRNLRIFPNPATDVVFVEAPITVRMYLTDATGRLVYRAAEAGRIDVSKLAAGMYILNITTTNGTLLRAEKLIKTGD